ncbi:hypothetical protein CROQUDRAFT_208969 [Cronartium quercuum f. sp. fusiforme G11]|uniref:Secreted protein n=1 Tax=Cronartium quercuum f. sp. fusiforme G11 TaxID=708437 RepID=A0A9P6T8U0_9BASI|nr:hypothetical protein CROQUDRAFT_208969 [Cronartium quercuum f. sp. fusiforme G11]
MNSFIMHIFSSILSAAVLVFLPATISAQATITCDRKFAVADIGAGWVACQNEGGVRYKCDLMTCTISDQYIGDVAMDLYYDGCLRYMGTFGNSGLHPEPKTVLVRSFRFNRRKKYVDITGWATDETPTGLNVPGWACPMFREYQFTVPTCGSCLLLHKAKW